eukprot:GILJ01011338.1.p1 GENE.GILJ01011338.1~~GILJ01011338.1.p1  ORF type:complete len:620 (-),score=102.32 GILJ01011338.1:159-2018(-)
MKPAYVRISVRDFEEVEPEDDGMTLLKGASLRFERPQISKLLRSILPPLEWVPKYQKSWLVSDIIAGLTVSVLLIPQSMAYSFLAGLPPIYGLYTSTVPLIVYAFFASSTALNVGPVATTAIVLGSIIKQFASTEEELVALSFTMAFLTGAVMCLMGFFRLGFLVNFMSRPVMAGFTSAAAFIIGASQLKDLAGLKMENSELCYVNVYRALLSLPSTNFFTFGISVFCVCVLMGVRQVKRIPKWFPVQLLLVAALVAFSYFADLKQYGIQILGPIPAGLPAFSVPNLSQFPALFRSSLILALVSYMGSISLAKIFATKRKQLVDPNQELVALGMSCFMGSFFSGHVISGSFTRTVINHQMGAKTPFANVVTAVFILLALVCLTSLFEFLPKCVLAAMIVSAIKSLVETEEAKFLWQVRRMDFLQMALSFGSTLFFGIQQGLLISVAGSMLLVIYNSVNPPIDQLGRLPNTTIYKNMKRFPQAIVDSTIEVIRMGGDLYFANVGKLATRLREHLHHPHIKAVILDASPLTSIDTTALREVADIFEEYNQQGVSLCFAACSGPVRDAFVRSHLADRLGPRVFFLSVHDAVQSVESDTESAQVDESIQEEEKHKPEISGSQS